MCSREVIFFSANFEQSVVSRLPEGLPHGVYYGFAQVDNGPIHRMVMSIGKNVQFGEQSKTMETHILHKFEKDFYGSFLKSLIIGYIRPMKSFGSLDELIQAIRSDITFANKQLSLGKNEVSRFSHFF
ncbi:unnamed protein product [Soboliphyme baturini]|uniref:riboflavin kinase n=1 Tax=Soboliphyme baturini TaxID=241478 RepID=A0A183IRL4_9BILA|nr:unnamed protein product [Soboliphyme baturini]